MVNRNLAMYQLKEKMNNEINLNYMGLTPFVISDDENWYFNAISKYVTDYYLVIIITILILRQCIAFMKRKKQKEEEIANESEDEQINQILMLEELEKKNRKKELDILNALHSKQQEELYRLDLIKKEEEQLKQILLEEELEENRKKIREDLIREKQEKEDKLLAESLQRSQEYNTYQTNILPEPNINTNGSSGKTHLEEMGLEFKKYRN